MTPDSSISPARTGADAPRTVTLLHADLVSARRAEGALRSAGAPWAVQAVSEPPLAADAPDVLLVWAGRGITARDALLSRLRAELPDTRIVVVGPTDSPSSIRAAIEAGADGVVFDSEVDSALPAVVAAVLAGQVTVPSVHRRQLGVPNLTAREKQILGMVVMGLSNKEIGGRLFLAQSTIKSHLSSVFGKLGVRSRHEAVTLILDPEQKLGLGILGISSEAQRTVEVSA